MDYSLLIAIEKENITSVQSSSDNHDQNRRTIETKEGTVVDDYVGELISQAHCYRARGRVYHIAIIDYLQAWTFNKKFERFSKTTFMGKDGSRLSAIEPQTYACRFRNFVESNVFN